LLIHFRGYWLPKAARQRFLPAQQLGALLAPANISATPRQPALRIYHNLMLAVAGKPEKLLLGSHRATTQTRSQRHMSCHACFTPMFGSTVTSDTKFVGKKIN
jgi:hypothetical protein